MSNIDKLNDHELVDLKRDIERELKRRAEGPKITTYYVVSCITDAQWLLACDGNKVQEYVRIERYQEAVIGNSPVQSPIDHGYRPECECSGCKATARICAELNNEEAEIFADGYNAAMQSFGNSEQLNSPVTPDGWISCSERMPEDEQEVIVQNKLGYRYVSYFDEHSGLFFDMPGGNQMNCIEHILVTHWMPLPAAPQPEVK